MVLHRPLSRWIDPPLTEFQLRKICVNNLKMQPRRAAEAAHEAIVRFDTDGSKYLGVS